MTKEWKLAGIYFEACTCEVACPCVFLSTPSKGECKAFVGWHIAKGHFGEVNLDGLNVAATIHSPGHMLHTKWKLGLYLDERGNQVQRDALVEIFGGRAGGHPATLASFVGEVLGVKPVPIEFSATGKERSLRIPNVLEMEVAAIEGQGGAEVTVANQPLCVVPGVPSVIAKSKRVGYTDYSSLELAGTNGFYSTFSYQP